MRSVLIALVLVLGLSGAEGCGALYRSAKKIQGPPEIKEVGKAIPEELAPPKETPLDFTFSGDAIKDHLGPFVSTEAYSGKGYIKAGGGPSKDLSCDFDGGECCWSNPGLPLDQLDWRLGSGRPNAALMKSELGSGDLPSGGFLVLGSGAVAAADEAQLLGCSVQCARGPVKVSLRHWQTYEALLQVCTKSSLEADAPLLNCQELPREASPGPTTLNLPASQLFDIVIVASNLVEETGNVVVIDDLKVAFESCDGAKELEGGDYGIDDSDYGAWGDEEDNLDSEKNINGGLGDLVPSVLSTSQVSEGAEYPDDYVSSEGLCSAECSFEDGSSCGFVSIRGSGYNGDFAVAKRSFKNRATGIRRPGQGRSFAAVFLRPAGKAGLQASFPPSPSPVRASFKYYEVTQGVQLSACCDSEANCPLQSDFGVSVGDRAWQDAEISCPSGTRRLLFVCHNHESNQGACGLDHVRIQGC